MGSSEKTGLSEPSGRTRPTQAPTTGCVAISENDLSVGLQPIRMHFLAQAIHTLFTTGLYDRMYSQQSHHIDELGRATGLDEHRLEGFLEYLANEGLVQLRGGIANLTPDGKSLTRLRPWYTLLIGGYAESLLQLASCLADPASYATRNGNCVGAGSTGISQHDALPMTKHLLERCPKPVDEVIDIGCGDGSFLIELCAATAGLTGLGLDPELHDRTESMRRAEAAGVGERIRFEAGTAQQFDVGGRVYADRTVCFLVAFALQEILEQSGRETVVKLLREIIDSTPETYVIVIEVEKVAAGGLPRKDLALAYYNPYYLIHEITEQRLESTEYWRAVFADAGCHVLDTCVPDHDYDSLDMKVGFLLGTRPDSGRR